MAKRELNTVKSRAVPVFTVFLLMLISTLRMADYELIAPLYDPISRELKINDFQFGLIRSITDFSAIAGVMLFGVLADRWRRRDILAIGVTGWSAAIWVMGYVKNYLQLMISSTLMRFFQASFTLTVYPMISDLVPRRSRGIVLGLMGSTYAIGTVIGLAVPALMGTGQWRRSFIYFGIPGILLGILVLSFLREPARGASEDEVGESGSYSGRFSWRMLGRTIKTRTVLLVWLLDACEGSTWYAFSFWTPAYLLRQKIAPNADAAALALLPAIGGFVVGNITGGWLTDRWRKITERSAIWVALISMSGALLMTAVIFSITSLTMILVAGFVMGFFGHMVMAPITVMLFDVVPPETRSSATAAGGLIMSLFMALTSLAIGAISHYAGLLQGLSEGNLRAGFQISVTVLLGLGILCTLAILKTAPSDMAALRRHVARGAVRENGDRGNEK